MLLLNIVNYFGVYFTSEQFVTLDTYSWREMTQNIVYCISSIIIGNGCAHDLDKLLVPHGSVGLDVGLAEDLVNCKRVKL